MSLLSTTLSYLILAGTSIYCYKLYYSFFENVWKFGIATFAVIIFNSIVGIYRWGNPKYGISVERVYQFSKLCQLIIALPCLVTDVWITYNYSLKYAIIHLLISTLPILIWTKKRKVKDNVIDVLTAVNLILLTAICYANYNYFGIAAAISYFINHFILKYNGDIFELPPRDLHNYGICFFCYFALKTLKD